MRPSRKTPKSDTRKATSSPLPCKLLSDEISSLADYLEVFDPLYSKPDDIYWFRGHANKDWTLCPSALRPADEGERTRAINSIAEFRHRLEYRLPKAPLPKEKFKWLQIAQHYGLPTRLLDWTQSPAVALYFACQEENHDGAIYVINPRNLNRVSKPDAEFDIVDPDEHEAILNPYLALDGKSRARGLKTIAVKPTWNSERIILQQGMFTLHGVEFDLNSTQVPSLMGVQILRKHKQRLLHQLERIGIAETVIFPEPEHVCHFLKQRIRKP